MFYSLNNNDAEVYGIYVAIKTLFERYGVRDFLIYNDSIIACSMVKDGAVINNSVKKNHSLLMDIKYYLYENNIKVKTVRLPRHDPTLKICDKLSKSFRAKGRK